MEFIPVPYGWQRRILASDLVVYLSPTNELLDSLDVVRRYLETPSSCKCGLQCPLIVDKVFNFDPAIKSKSWEVTQVLDGTHCRQKSNILEMATLTNCIDSFCETEQKPGKQQKRTGRERTVGFAVKRRKRTHAEISNGNVFVCSSNPSNLVQTNSTSESVVFVNSTGQASGTNSPIERVHVDSIRHSDAGQSMSWTSLPQTGVTPPSKRPRGRPRKTAVTSPVIAQLAVKPAPDSHHQPVPSSILSPPASVSSISQANLVHRNSISPSTQHSYAPPTTTTTSNVRYLNDHVLTPSSISDTNVIARVPSLFEQVKTTTNESTFAVLSGVQNVLLSPNRDSTNSNGAKRVRLESASSIVSSTTTTTVSGKHVTLNVNALKPDFVRSPAAAQKPCPTAGSSNQIDVISLMGTSNQTPLMTAKPPPKAIAPAMITVPSTINTDEHPSIKSTSEPSAEPSQPLMIDFNDPSTTNFLLSALASGASSDSNAIVNHLFQKAQTQQQQQQQHRHVPSPPPPAPSLVTIKKKVPILSAGLKNCTETTNLLPVANPTNVAMRQSVVLHVPSGSVSTHHESISSSQSQQIIFSSHTDDRKQPQQIFFINNKPYVIQQKLAHDSSSQQRLVLTPSVGHSDGSLTIPVSHSRCPSRLSL